LWGDWRCTANPRFFTAECMACGGSLWVHRSGEQWRAACENGCSLTAIDAFAHAMSERQRKQREIENELRATMQPDDPFHDIDADVYIPALTGREVVRGFAKCPFHGGGEERTPSLHVSGPVWHCHGCHAGGSIYDFGALLWGLEPRRDGFREIRQQLALALRATWAA
jgi:hypothetical protein